MESWAPRGSLTGVFVFGHDDASGDDLAVAPARFFQFPIEGAVSASGLEQRLSSVTTEGDEVEVAGLRNASQAGGHGEEVLHPARPVGKNRGKGSDRAGFGGLPHLKIKR